MPTRKRTRVQERRDRVYTERYRNYLRIDEEAWEQQLASTSQHHSSAGCQAPC